MMKRARRERVDALRSLTNATAMVRTESLRGFKDVVANLRGDPVGLLESAGIEPSLLERKGEIRYAKVVELFETAASTLRCPDFGMRLAAMDDTLSLAADLASADVMTLNQEACVASRFLYVEGGHDQVDRFCEKLHKRIVERASASGDVRPLDMTLREQIETLMLMDDDYRVWGKTDGRGCVIRSAEPVEFHPINKTANVVCVPSLDDAVKYINVATQTVGFYPFNRMADYRDRFASGGAQRIVHLGEAGPSTIGNPHDAMYPLHRFVHWMVHEDGCTS